MDLIAEIDVYECEACGSRGEDLGFKRPFQSLEGRVRLSSAAELKILSVEATLQGKLRKTFWRAIAVSHWRNDQAFS